MARNPALILAIALRLASWWCLGPAARAESSPPAGCAETIAPDIRQQILEHLADEIASGPDTERWHEASIIVNGDVAVVQLPPDAAAGPGSGAVFVFGRDAGGVGLWSRVAKITVPGEAHFGDSMLLGRDTLVVAAPEQAGAGLGLGTTYVFRRHVGGADRWGLLAKLAPAPYPPPEAVLIEWQPPAAGAAEADLRAEILDHPLVPPENGDPSRGLEAGGPERPGPQDGDSPLFIVAASMKEARRAVSFAVRLRGQGYPSEVYRTDDGYFVVTLDRLPLDEARRTRREAVSAGVISKDSYLISGTSLREKISP